MLFILEVVVTFHARFVMEKVLCDLLCHNWLCSCGILFLFVNWLSRFTHSKLDGQWHTETPIWYIEAMFGIHFSLGCTIAAFRIWRVRRRRCDAWAGQSAVGWVEQSLFALRY